ncbi:hypothetical protein N7523_010760 [Penicillium sp. IBT 18751x]|nr:hypothetical protein N7523_010760 [Penicillium sp. IBT 18751x]
MITPRQSSIRPFFFSLLVVSAISSKALHLYQHGGSLDRARLILYFPTFFLQEGILFAAAWILLQRSSVVRSVAGTIATSFIAFLTFILASSQIGFYFVTGSEVRWDAATSVGNDPEGRKLMLSGLRSFLGAAGLLVVLSWLCTTAIWMIACNFFSAVLATKSAEKADEELPLDHLRQNIRRKRLLRLWALLAVMTTVGLRLMRPQVPYNHMSGALPFTFFEALRSKSKPDQLGWAPGGHDKIDTTGRPEWASKFLPHGFQRWKNGPESVHGPEEGQQKPPQNYYNPANDPLRITNLDQNVVEPIVQAIKSRNVPINHVFLVMMESARKDIFPLKAGSHLHHEILSSYHNPDPAIIRHVNSKLSSLTPVAEQLTGEPSGFRDSGNGSDGLWKDTAESGMGGINVNGILTGSSLSFKSAVMNHCGVGPIPVDFMDEVKAKIYQPCIMQILDLFNQLKEDLTGVTTPSIGLNDAQNRNWTSVFLQSITGLYDDQDLLNNQMGFKKAIYSEDIGRLSAKHYHPGMEEVNYFGYAEREVYPYLRDIVNEAIENKQRLFLSHFTSTTHHPWSTPTDFHDEQYFSLDGLMSKHEDMNNYLNTVRYVDGWLGDILKVLDDTGIANETLVVFVGDHGQAFNEDSPVSGTYENGHISNFRIPLVFRHPLLPKIQITANATSMSIVPTILDLLVQTGSLNDKDSTAALDLLNEYEGQSLIRPYQPTHNGRQAWNFGIINAGGTMLSVGSAAVPYRLILPLTEDFEFLFTNLNSDPEEICPLRGWSAEELIPRVRSEHGEKAAQWVNDAEKVGRWQNPPHAPPPRLSRLPPSHTEFLFARLVLDLRSRRIPHPGVHPTPISNPVPMADTYASDPEWADITPIPLNDGSESGAMPLATIAYPDEYLEATSYLRAVMAANEMSERALKLTENVISMNPAHYTVWIYRAKILFALDKDLLEELEWLNGVSLKYLKNYQIWSHRQILMGSETHFPTLPPKELPFLMEMFAQDSKNYHVWTYRHWLVRRFGLWDHPRELEDVDALLKADVRNNSAWNHRYMLRFGPRGDEPDAGMVGSVAGAKAGVHSVVDEDVVDSELEVAKNAILKAPENRSPWWYARGVLRAASRGLGEWEEFAGLFVTGGVIRSTHAVEWLADVYADGRETEAVQMLTLLREKYDPVRKNYWDYRIKMLGQVA